jgi:hypothetical protein
MFYSKRLVRLILLVAIGSVSVASSSASADSGIQTKKTNSLSFSFPLERNQSPLLALPVTQDPASSVRAPVYFKYLRPRRLERTVEHFVPWSEAAPSQIQTIINVEASRWGASAARLACRIHGESTDEWQASNGQYVGVGQFAPSTFTRGMSSIHSRSVRWVEDTYAWRWIQRVKYLGGFVKAHDYHYKRVRVKRVIVHLGMIPKDPPVTHTWAQIRIMAQAMVGISAVSDTEWQVRC